MFSARAVMKLTIQRDHAMNRRNSTRARPDTQPAQTRISGSLHLALMLATVGTHVLLFLLLYPRLGLSVTTLAVLPVVVAAWLWGLRAGLIAGGLGTLLNTVLANLAGRPGWDAVIGTPGGALGAVALVLIGMVIGRLRDLEERAHREIAERVRAEEAREAVRKLLQTTVDGVSDPIMVIGPDYRVKLMNQAVREHYPVGEETDGLCCYQVSHNRDTPCGGDAHPCPLEEVLRSRRPVTVVHEHVRESGEKRFVEIVASPLPGEDGTVTGIVESARDITERKRAEEAAQERASLMARLASLAETLNRTLTVNQVIAAIGEGMLALSHADRAAVYLRRDDDTVTCPWYQGLSPAYVEQVTTRAQELPGGQLLETPEPVLIPDVEDLPEESPLQELARAEGYRAAAFGPLVYEGRTVAAAACYYVAPYSWTAAEQEAMEALCRQAAVTLEKLRLVQQERRLTGQLSALNRAALTMTAELEPDRVLQTITDLGRELVSATYAALAVPDEHGRVTQLYTAGITDEERAAVGDLPQGRGLLGHLLREAKPLRLDDLRQHPLSTGFPPHHPHMTSFLGVPIISRGKVLGSLYLGDKKTSEVSSSRSEPTSEVLTFTAEDQQVIETLAAQAAVAIENARLFSEVQQLSITDELTRLYNRRYFDRQLKSEFRRALRYDRPLSLLMLDLDHFKRINDQYGHPAGDVVLAEVAGVLCDTVRDTDTVARYGGEEFAVILPETDLTGAISLAEKLRQAVAEHRIEWEHHILGITISAGVAALLDQEPATRQELVSQADQALYAAKQAGRDRVCRFGEEYNL